MAEEQSVAQKLQATVEAATVFVDPATKAALRRGMEAAAPELKEAREKKEKEAAEAAAKAKAEAEEAAKAKEAEGKPAAA
jgi:hypothetical protein